MQNRDITIKDTRHQDPCNTTTTRASSSTPKVLIIEPFYGGSHQQLLDLVISNFKEEVHLVTLSAKKWHWRARCSALVISRLIPSITSEEVLFTTSVLNLAELLGLRPELSKLKKVVYFHENQLVYPVQQIKARDIQFAYNQITTCLTADLIIFNSHYNKNSFLTNIKTVIKIMPDYRPKDLCVSIEPKCDVMYFPIDYTTITIVPPSKGELLQIVWPHRWEFDKNPEVFVNILFQLKAKACKFRLSIIGETFQDIPPIMTQAKEQISEEIVHFGFAESKEEYYKILQSCHIAVSTSQHEFFGVSMLEAAYCGCFPLVPNRLVYPEIYPKECLYNNDNELLERLEEYCSNPNLATEHRRALIMDFDRFSASNLLPKYFQLFS